MNEDHQPFDSIDFNDPLERRLRGLRPAKMPLELTLRLESQRPRRLTWLSFAVPLAAAAVWFLVFYVAPRNGESNSIASNASSEGSSLTASTDLRVFVPVEEKSTLVGVSELGVVEDDPVRPVRLMRCSWQDDTTFQSDDGRSTLRQTAPREQIIPVALEVY
jgi:hypothetical protein